MVLCVFGKQADDARAAMLLYRARREEWEKELRKKHVHKYVRSCLTGLKAAASDGVFVNGCCRYRITTGVSARAITTTCTNAVGHATTTMAAMQQETTANVVNKKRREGK